VITLIVCFAEIKQKYDTNVLHLWFCLSMKLMRYISQLFVPARWYK